MHRKRFATALILALSGPAAIAQTTPESNDTMDIARLLRDDARMIVMGDSFAAPNWQAIFPAILLNYDKSPVTAIYSGTGPDNTLGTFEPLATTLLEVNASTPSGYQVFTREPIDTFFTLPIRGIVQMHNAFTFEPGADGGLMRMGLNHDRLQFIRAGRLWSEGDTVGFRPTYLMPQLYGTMHQSLGVRPAFGGPGEPIEFNPYTQSRPMLHLGAVPDFGLPSIAHPGQINAAYRDLVMTISPSNPDGAVELYATDGNLLPNTYATSAGGVYYRIDPETGKRARGLYYSSLSDNSWSFSGFGANREGASEFDKNFSVDQLVHWLDVTTIDESQPIVFVYYLATEVAVGKATTKQRLRDMIQQSQNAAGIAGLLPVQHLLVAPHNHRIFNVEQTLVEQRFRELNEAMYELSVEIEDVGFVSIYEATDRVLLTGSNEARDWIATNIPQPYNYADRSVDFLDTENRADLLDLYQIHPAGEAAAAYFGELFLDVLFRSSAIDFNGDLILDTADISAFVDSFITGDPSADLNGDAVLDNSDIRAFVDAFVNETSG